MEHPAPSLAFGHERPQWVPTRDEGGDVQAIKNMGAGMVERHGERPGRDISQPAFTIRASAGGMEPGGFRWQPEEGDEVTKLDPIRVTPQEAAALQSYPEDFVWCGAKTKQYLQIGNAVPVLLAQRVLEALWATPAADNVVALPVAVDEDLGAAA